MRSSAPGTEVRQPGIALLRGRQRRRRQRYSPPPPRWAACSARNRLHFRSPESRSASAITSSTTPITSAAGSRYGSNYDVERFPLEDYLLLLRRYLWLAIDRAYKSAVEAISRKRAALRTSAPPSSSTISPRPSPVKRVEPVSPSPRRRALEGAGAHAVRDLREVSRRRTSSVEFSGISDVRYMVNSEGTEVRIQEHVALVRARATARRRRHEAARRSGLPFQPSRRFAAEAGDGTSASRHWPRTSRRLAKAPKGERLQRSGPVRGRGRCADLRRSAGQNLALARRPVMEPGRPGAIATSELEGRIGARILPDWMDVVDDPTQTEWRGRPLFGHYAVDREGVAAPSPSRWSKRACSRTSC